MFPNFECSKLLKHKIPWSERGLTCRKKEREDLLVIEGNRAAIEQAKNISSDYLVLEEIL